MTISKGIQYMLLASFMFAFMNLFAKYLNRIPVSEIVFFRSTVSLIIAGGWLARQKINPFGGQVPWLLARGLFGAVSLVLYFLTIRHMKLATAIVVQYFSPVFTTMVAWLVLKERIYKLQWLFLGLSTLGIILIKGFDNVEPLWFFAGIASAFFSGWAYTMIRKVNTAVDPNVIVFWFPFVTFPLSLLMPYLFNETWVMPSVPEFFLLLMVGLFTQGAQYFMTRAYQAEAASRIAPVTYSGLVYGIIFGMIFFNEYINLLTAAGMLMVVLGIVLHVKTASIVKWWQDE